MGYHILLHCTAIIKPEYIDYIKLEYFNCYDDEGIPEAYKEYFLIWQDIDMYSDGGGFYQFNMEGDRFTFTLCKRPYFFRIRNKSITLERDYKRLMRDIIAPISSEILHCEIEHDDFGDDRYTYTDEEVRRYFDTD